jgi:Beta-lactamase enzyme family
MFNRRPLWTALLSSAAAFAILAGCASTSTTKPNIDAVLAGDQAKFGSLMQSPEKYRLQFLVSDVVPGPGGRPALRRSGFRVDSEYFYPASTIKLAAAMVACQRAAELDAERPGREARAQPTMQTPLAFHPLFERQSLREIDASNVDSGAITLSHQIRKLFLVSDNPAYNRLYEFVGQESLNTRLWAAGLSSARLSHRLAEGRTPEQNRLTPMIELRYSTGTRTLPSQRSTLELVNTNVPGLDVGRAYRTGDGSLIEKPMNFARTSRISLVDLQDLLVMLVHPSIDLGKPGLKMSDQARYELTTVMSSYAADSTNPVFAASEHPDDDVKFLLPGLLRIAPKADWRIVNKIGQAYGFSIDNAYVEHIPTGRGLYVTAVIYTNAAEILNSDNYEYSTIAMPFFADLGEVVGRRLTAP